MPEPKQRIGLTTPIVRAIEPPASGRTYVYDAKLPGLALCVTANGTRTFYLCRRVEGRPSRIVLGRFPALTLEQARLQAVTVAAKIAGGANPNAEKRANRNGMTLGETFDHFIENRTARNS